MDSAQEDGVASEKKSLHARERDTEANQQRRAAFVEKLGTIAPEKLIFLDESGVTTQMTRAWGRAPKGERIAEATPHGHWQVLTTLGAMSLGGMAAVITVAAATTAKFFAPMWSRCCPRLRPGDVVVMDNLSAHKVRGVRERIEAQGAELLYLPTVLARHESHRESLVQAQTFPAWRQSAHSRRARSSHHRSAQNNYRRERCRLVPPLRICITELTKML